MGRAGLGRAQHIGHIYCFPVLIKSQLPRHGLRNGDGVGRKVDMLPLECQKLTDTHAGEQQRGDDGAHDRILLHRGQHCFTLSDGDDFFLRFRALRLPGQFCAAGGIDRGQRHFYGVVVQLDQDTAHQRSGAAGELLFRLQIIEERLDAGGCQLGNRDVSQRGNDM